MSERHPDGGGWEGGAALRLYEAALKVDETNVVRARLAHAARVPMRMAGTVEAPDCGASACTRSCLTPCLAPCTRPSPRPHPTSHGYARRPSLPETRTGRPQTEWVGVWAGEPVGERAREQVGMWVGGR